MPYASPLAARRCGRVFCAQCTSRKLRLTPQLVVDVERGAAVRVCATCFDECVHGPPANTHGIGPEQAPDDEQAPPARDWTAALVRARAKQSAQARLDIADALHRWEQASLSSSSMLAPPLPGAMVARAAAEGVGVRWEEDNSRLDCPHCGAHFSAYRRRHHCRLCGRLCCAPCSQKLTSAGAGVRTTAPAPAPRSLSASFASLASGGGGVGSGGGSGEGGAMQRSVSSRMTGALVAAASAGASAAGLPAPSIRTCVRCAQLLRRHAIGVAHADALACANESGLVRAYMQLSAARAAISEQLSLYARAVARLDLALDPQSLAAELQKREALLASLLPKAMLALKAVAAVPVATVADARLAAQIKAMAIAFLQSAAPRFHALKRAAELKLAQAREEAEAAKAARAAILAEAASGAAKGGGGSSSGIGSGSGHEIGVAGAGGSAVAAAAAAAGEGTARARFLSRVLARTRSAAAAAAATPAVGGVGQVGSAVGAAVGCATSAAVGTLSDLVPVRGGAVLARLLHASGGSAPSCGHAAQQAAHGVDEWRGQQPQQLSVPLPTAAHLDSLTHALVLISRLSLLKAVAVERLSLGRALGEVIREIHGEIAFWAEERGEDVGARDAAITADVTAAAAHDAFAFAPMGGAQADGGASLLEQVANGPRGPRGGGSGTSLEDGDSAALSEMALIVGEACSLVETEVPEAASTSSRAALSALRQKLKATCAALGHTAAMLGDDYAGSDGAEG